MVITLNHDLSSIRTLIEVHFGNLLLFVRNWLLKMAEFRFESSELAPKPGDSEALKGKGGAALLVRGDDGL
jgi:hypothetical protein